MYIIRKCTYVYLCLCMFCNKCFSFLAPLRPLGLHVFIVQHFLKKCDNGAMPQSVKNTEHVHH